MLNFNCLYFKTFINLHVMIEIKQGRDYITRCFRIIFQPSSAQAVSFRYAPVIGEILSPKYPSHRLFNAIPIGNILIPPFAEKIAYEDR